MSERKWTVPHKAAVDDLGPIRFGEEMPPNDKIWRLALAGVVILGLGLCMAKANAQSPTPRPGISQHEAIKLQRSSDSQFGAGIFFAAVGACCIIVSALEFWRTTLVGSYSLHEKGAMAIIRGKESRIYYDDVDEMTVRARRLKINGKLVGDGLWVTFASRKLGTPPVRFFRGLDARGVETSREGLMPRDVMAVCNDVAARIAARIRAVLASGRSYAFTSTVWLSPDGVVLSGWFRDNALRWEEIAQLDVVSGHCFLFKRGGKKPVARWRYKTKNCMPVCMIINHAAKSKLAVEPIRR